MNGKREEENSRNNGRKLMAFLSTASERLGGLSPKFPQVSCVRGPLCAVAVCVVGVWDGSVIIEFSVR